MISLTLGFMPLTDCAPLVVAKHVGFFEKWGLDVTLSKQNSWATLRDKLHANLLDAAHILAPMPLASALGLGVPATNIITPFVLSQQGNAITLSKSLFAECKRHDNTLSQSIPLESSALVPLIQERAKQNKKLTFATVFPYSCHFYQLNTWLSEHGISLSDVRIIVIPPPLMVAALAQGSIDGFCVGSPYNAKAVRTDVGVTVATSCDIWPTMPEKVLGMHEQWALENKNTVTALVGALSDACSWLGQIPNRFEAARLLTAPEYLGLALDIVTPSLLGSCLSEYDKNPRVVPYYNLFGEPTTKGDNCPSREQGEWLLERMVKAGHIQRQHVPDNLVESVFREDLYNCALKEHQMHRKSEKVIL